MPPLARAGFSHEAVADHRILRRAQGSERPAGRPASVASQEMPVVSFYPDRRDLKDKDAARDLGVALAEFGWEESIPYPEVFCRWALPLLETALEAWPDDVAGWEAKGFALAQLGRGVDAQAAFRSALALAPNRERTLAVAAQQAQLLGHGAEARAYWRRARAVIPCQRDYHC